MAGNARNLLLFIILAGGALVTWVLARVTQETAAPITDSGPAPQGYYLIDAVMNSTNEEGRLTYRILAQRVEQEGEGENFVLDRMSVEYTPDTDVQWDVSAERGLADADLDTLHLEKDVQLAYRPRGDQDETVFQMNGLELHADEFRATTNQQVTGRMGQNMLTASGLDLDLKSDLWKLFALTLLAVPAEGQTLSNGGIELVCLESSGNARSGERACVDVRISDGTSEISAGLATTSKFDFDDSIWSLSDEVRLAFDTTEILAGEAKFTFEANELVLAELSGNPVEMSDYIEERDTRVSGTATSISYDARTGAVRLIGQATLMIGDNEVTACDLTYNLREKTYEAGAVGDCAGVTLRLPPPEENNDPQAPARSP